MNAPEEVPLYVGPGARLDVDADAGFVVEKEGVGLLRLPVRACARVVLASGARFSSEALDRCVREGRPVVWMDGDGRALACLHAWSGAPADGWANVLRLALASPAWNERFSAWKRAQHRMALRSLAARFGVRLSMPDPERALDELLARLAVRRRWGLWALRHWRGWAVPLVAEVWRAVDAPVEALVAPALGFDLMRDAGECVGLDMLDPLAREAARWRKVRGLPPREARRELIAALERRRRRLAHLSVAFLMRFRAWLLEWPEWR